MESSFLKELHFIGSNITMATEELHNIAVNIQSRTYFEETNKEEAHNEDDKNPSVESLQRDLLTHLDHLTEKGKEFLVQLTGELAGKQSAEPIILDSGSSKMKRQHYPWPHSPKTFLFFYNQGRMHPMDLSLFATQDFGAVINLKDYEDIVFRANLTHKQGPFARRFLNKIVPHAMNPWVVIPADPRLDSFFEARHLLVCLNNDDLTEFIVILEEVYFTEYFQKSGITLCNVNDYHCIPGFQGITIPEQNPASESPGEKIDSIDTVDHGKSSNIILREQEVTDQDADLTRDLDTLVENETEEASIHEDPDDNEIIGEVDYGDSSDHPCLFDIDIGNDKLPSGNRIYTIPE